MIISNVVNYSCRTISNLVSYLKNSLSKLGLSNYFSKIAEVAQLKKGPELPKDLSPIVAGTAYFYLQQGKREVVHQPDNPIDSEQTLVDAQKIFFGLARPQAFIAPQASHPVTRAVTAGFYSSMLGKS